MVTKNGANGDVLVQMVMDQMAHPMAIGASDDHQ